MSYESGPYFLHYMIESGVCYLTLCDRGYPKKLAYRYLEDLQKEFAAQNGAAVDTVARWGPADIARHVVERTFKPRLFRQRAFYDVTSNRQAVSSNAPCTLVS
jgi:hypothetical protein